MSLSLRLLCCTSLILGGAAGCSKTPSPAAKPSKGAQPAQAKPAAPVDDEARMRKALTEGFHRSRCAMVGDLKSPWAGSPWKDDAGFRAAFDEAAKADPVWAERVVADSYRRPCKVDPKAKPKAKANVPSAPAKDAK